MIKVIEILLKIIRWIQYRGYKRKISSLIGKQEITDFLLDPNEEGYITVIKHKGLEGFNRNPFESLGFEIDDEKINFKCAVKFHYMYWIVKQIYGCKKIFKDIMLYKDFSLCVDERFTKWVGGNQFDKTIYILYKIRDNMNKGLLKKPEAVSWEVWEQILENIRLYINFYAGGNYSLCLNFVLKGQDKYSVLKENIILGYEALKFYWRIFD